MVWPNTEGAVCDRCLYRYPMLLVVFVHDLENPDASATQRWCFSCVTNRGAALVTGEPFNKNPNPE